MICAQLLLKKTLMHYPAMLTTHINVILLQKSDYIKYKYIS